MLSFVDETTLLASKADVNELFFLLTLNSAKLFINLERTD
jgi:hypothetical protein